MTSAPEPSRARRPLNEVRIVAAAVAMIDEDGLEAFSLPRVAASLGVRTSALYRHFAHREALLAAVARTVATAEEDHDIPPNTSWTEALIAQAVALRRRIGRHPACAPLLVQYMPKDGVFDRYDEVCRYLDAAGVPAAFHVRIVDALTALTVGSAFLDESAADYLPEGRGPTPDAREHPTLTRALSAIAGTSADELFVGFLRTHLAAIVAEMGTDAP